MLCRCLKSSAGLCVDNHHPHLFRPQGFDRFAMMDWSRNICGFSRDRILKRKSSTARDKSKEFLNPGNLFFLALYISAVPGEPKEGKGMLRGWSLCYPEGLGQWNQSSTEAGRAGIHQPGAEDAQRELFPLCPCSSWEGMKKKEPNCSWWCSVAGALWSSGQKKVFTVREWQMVESVSLEMWKTQQNVDFEQGGWSWSSAACDIKEFGFN